MIKRARNIDPMHSQWGVHHFHLGNRLECEFVSRTDPLLFAIVREDNIYVLGGDWVKKKY